MGITGFAELTLQTRDPRALARGDRSLYVTDPEGNVVEVWDYFERGGSVARLAASSG